MNQIQKQKQTEAMEKKVEEEKKKALIEHQKKIQAQIAANESLKKQDRLDYLEEGKKVRESIQADRDKIKDIQAAKINELGNLGIDNKYMYELQKKTVSF